jgi:membrane protease YdiL (CAAX protease family)
MAYEDSNPSAAAPARAPSGEAHEALPRPPIDPILSEIQMDPPPPAPPQFDASVPEDLQTPFQLVDLFLFIGFGILSLLVAGGIVVGAGVFVFHMSMGILGQDSTSAAKPIVAIFSQVLWSGFVLIYFYTLVRVRTDSPFWRTMGWRGLNLGVQPVTASLLRCMGGGAILAVIVSFFGRFLNEKTELPIEALFHSRLTVILLMVFGILVAPIVEETMFRGFLYPILARQFGIGAGVIVTGILFGAMHAQQLWGGWGQIGLLILVGILLTWIRAKTGTVAASYFVHLGYNSFLFLGFFLATGGLRHIPGAP